MLTVTALLVAAQAVSATDPATDATIANRVEIVRTEHGVPHIYAEDLEAMGFALAYVQSEDYGDQVAVGLATGRGTLGRLIVDETVYDNFVRITDSVAGIAESVQQPDSSLGRWSAC